MSAIHTPRPTLRRSEQGMISMLSTLILMIVISLIVLGFAQISRRNQRESTDRQLSTQAFYAAESGVNDAREIIQNAINTGQIVRDKTDCTGTGTAGFYTGLNPVIDAAHNVSYSCLTVDPAPKELRFSSISTTSTIVPLISNDGSAFSNLKLEWQSKAAAGNPLTGCPAAATAAFPPAASWGCGYGILRFDLVPTAGALTMDGLNDRTLTVFAIPLASGGTSSIVFPASTPVSAANTNNRMGASCTNSGCSLTVTGLNQNSYHLRVSSLYKDASLQLSATGSTGSQIRIVGAQAVIDSTGKAQDVLRRIQVNLPYQISNENQLSDYAIEAQGAICKRYAITQGFLSIDGDDVGSANPLCQTSTSP